MGTDTAAMARLLDTLRGGGWGLAAERRAAAAVTVAWPQAPETIRLYDRFRSAAAEDAVLRGMTAVIFAAAGYPKGDPPHLAAARASGTARFWFAEPDQVIAGQRALALDGGDRAAAVPADMRDPRGMLTAAGLLGNGGEWLGGGPCQLQWGLMAMVMDGGEAADLAAEYRKLLPSGSELVITVPDREQGRQFAVIAGARPHTAADAAGWCAEAGLELDRVADVRMWGREALGRELRGRGGRIVAAVARVP